MTQRRFWRIIPPMLIDSPRQRSRLPFTIGGLTLAISAAATIASMVSSKPDPEVENPSEKAKAKVALILADEKPANEPDATAPLQVQFKQLPKALPKLTGVPELTTQEKARNGDLEAAKTLVKTFDEKQRNLLNPPPGVITNPDLVDLDILKALGISHKELTLFRNAADLLFHVSLMDDGKKLKDLASSLEKDGAVFISGQDQESLLSGLRPRFIMRILCSQSYGPGGAQEQLFLKLTGKSPQQLQDLAHSVYDSFQGQSLSLDDGTVKCLNQIRGDFGFSSPAEEFDLELRQ